MQRERILSEGRDYEMLRVVRAGATETRIHHTDEAGERERERERY